MNLIVVALYYVYSEILLSKRRAALREPAVSRNHNFRHSVFLWLNFQPFRDFVVDFQITINHKNLIVVQPLSNNKQEMCV